MELEMVPFNNYSKEEKKQNAHTKKSFIVHIVPTPNDFNGKLMLNYVAQCSFIVVNSVKNFMATLITFRLLN